MQIEPLTRIDQIKKGDLMLISDGKEIIHTKAFIVKVSEHDGTEVIFNVKRNKFFNVGMYLERKSWAKDVRIVRMPSNVKLCPQEPIYKDGEVPVALCVHHHYASNVDLKTGASWRECIYCGKKKNW